MKSVGRDNEFQQIMHLLKMLRDGESGVHCHLSVTAPRRGGLSTFLQDLVELVRQESGMLPVFATFEDGLSEEHVDEVFRRIYDEIATQSADSPEFDGLLGTLLDACDRLREKQTLPVLILDAAVGMRHIEQHRNSLAQARFAPLPDRLRILVNMISDRDRYLGVVVGWDDEFDILSADWKAQDVPQRYQPSFPLWPDFGREDAWERYAEIIKLNGFTVAGEYSAFPRSRLPVGVILDALQCSERSTVDATLLFDVLRDQKGITDDATTTLNRDCLESLILRDEAISTGPLHECVTASEFRDYVEPTPRDGYVANEKLYEAWGLEPAHIIVSLERSTIQKYEDRPDGELAREVAEGLLNLLGNSNNVVEAIADFAFVEFELDPKFRISGDHAGIADLFVYLGRDDTDDLRVELLRSLETTERRPGGRAERMVILAHRGGFPDNQMKGALSDVLRRELEEAYTPLTTGTRATKEAPPALYTVELLGEHAVEMVYLARDPERGATQTTDTVQKAIKRHANRVFKEFPRLRSNWFHTDVLPTLLSRSYTQISVDTISESGDAPQASIQENLRRLADLNIVTEDDAGWVWRLADDSFLTELRDDPSQENLLRKYFFAHADWDSLAREIARAYGAHLVTFHDGELRAAEGVEVIRSRAESILSTCGEEIAVLRHMDHHAAEELDKRLQRARVRERAIDSRQAGDSLCRDLVDLRNAVKRKHQCIIELTNELRERVTTNSQELRECERSHDETLDVQRDECIERSQEPPLDKHGLEALVNELDSCLNRFREVAQAREELKSSLTHAVSIANGLKQHFKSLVQQAKYLAISGKGDKSAEAIQLNNEFVDVLDRLKAWSQTLPESPSEEISTQLEESNQKIGKLQARAAQLSARLKQVESTVAITGGGTTDGGTTDGGTTNDGTTNDGTTNDGTTDGGTTDGGTTDGGTTDGGTTDGGTTDGGTTDGGTTDGGTTDGGTTDGGTTDDGTTDDGTTDGGTTDGGTTDGGTTDGGTTDGGTTDGGTISIACEEITFAPDQLDDLARLVRSRHIIKVSIEHNE